MNCWKIFIKCLLAILAVIIVFWLVHMTSPYAQAHSWYDAECCHKNDCTPVIKIERKGDYTIWYSKMFGAVKITDKEMSIRVRDGAPFDIKASKDSSSHICAYEYNVFYDEGGEVYPGRVAEERVNVMCLYIPGSV